MTPWHFLKGCILLLGRGNTLNLPKKSSGQVPFMVSVTGMYVVGAVSYLKRTYRICKL